MQMDHHYMNLVKYNKKYLILDVSCIDVNEYKNNNEIEELILSSNVETTT